MDYVIIINIIIDIYFFVIPEVVEAVVEQTIDSLAYESTIFSGLIKEYAFVDAYNKAIDQCWA